MRRALASIAAVLVCGCGPASDTGVLLIDAGEGTSTALTSETGDADCAPDGRSVFVAGEPDFGPPPQQTVSRFDTRGKRLSERVLETADVAAGLAVAPDGKRFAYIAPPRDQALVNTGELTVGSKRLLTRAYGPPAWSPDGRKLAVSQLSEAEARGDADGPSAPIVAVVDTEGRLVEKLEGLEPRWLPDGRLLVVRDDDLYLDGRAIARDVDTNASHWAPSPDGRRVAVPVGSGEVLVLDLRGGPDVRLAHRGPTELAWSPDGRRLAAIVDGAIELADPSGREAPRELAHFPDRVLSGLGWSPDGRRLLVTSVEREEYSD